MGYLRAWRENLPTLVLVVIVGVPVAVFLWLAGVTRAHHPIRASGTHKHHYVTFVVTGSAPGGVAVTEEEGGTSFETLATSARLPFRVKVSTDGSPSYVFVAKLLGSGRIRCAVSIYGVVDVKEASGVHGSCMPAVSEAARSVGWVAG
jgi:hypothetical protein